MKSSCIRHPEKTRYIQVYDWQIQFCQGNHCAALLLAFFINWHDWKLRHDQYYKRVNDIAEIHGDGRLHSEDAYLFFSTEELITGCMGFYGKQAVNTGIDLLASLGVITIHKNPNPRYHFDKTRYFKLYPTVCNRWIADSYPLDDEGNVEEPNASPDRLKMADRSAENNPPSNKNVLPSNESDRAITNTTNNTTNKNQSINARDEVGAAINALVEKGMPAKRFYPDAIDTILHLQEQGATAETFCKAYDLAHRTTQHNHYGVPYIAKIVEQLLASSRKQNTPRGKSPPSLPQKDQFSNTVYESDITNALKWMQGTNECKQD